MITVSNVSLQFGGDTLFKNVNLQNTAQNFQERGFSGTVCTDDPKAVSGVELQVDVLKNSVRCFANHNRRSYHHERTPDERFEARPLRL